jgi:SAM-dependent methyltransferase
MPSGPTYTHGHHESVLRAHRWRTAENSAAYLLPFLRSGDDLLDVGCGPGTITADLARLVAPGHVVGVDQATEAIQVAAATDLSAPVEFAVADVMALDWPDASFDVVHAHQVLQHLPHPVGALREMARVCRPDGLVAARDADYQAMAWYPEHPGLDRWLATYRSVARANGTEPDAGRRLTFWAAEAGLAIVQTSASVWCFAQEDDRQWWGRGWADRVRSSAFADHARRHGLANDDDLEAMAEAWLAWAGAPTGWFAVLHGEILCRPAPLGVGPARSPA